MFNIYILLSEAEKYIKTLDMRFVYNVYYCLLIMIFIYMQVNRWKVLNQNATYKHK